MNPEVASKVAKGIVGFAAAYSVGKFIDPLVMEAAETIIEKKELKLTKAQMLLISGGAVITSMVVTNVIANKAVEPVNELIDGLVETWNKNRN